ncbi:uncharacterized protein C2845_PM01G17890 [Panicum miliaceum]|uniref:Uncharacterized protein n=1 Tax=Panicum miliaceum TaxID=4540 RepID=A0A3L6TH59_PANMI|nr:uncharacterized protein C2845_PM01G17890 [Panicum miliaceum]
MASAEARAAALLFSCSAVAFLLLARAALLQPPHRRPADLLLAALDHLLPDGRGLLGLATRRNMVLLCHAILVVILMDAGVLGAPARRRAASAGAGAEEGACSAPAPARAAGRSVVVWRRQRNRAAARCDDAPRRLAERQRRPRGPRPAEAAAPWAAPALAGPAITAEPEELVATKQIVLMDKAPRSYLLDAHDRAAVAELEHQAPTIATGGRTDSNRGTIAADHGSSNAIAEAEETEGVQLADDRRIGEFIEKQWREIRQESLQLVRAAPNSKR